METEILVLGGYGRAGREVARKLLECDGSRAVRIAGRRGEAAREIAKSLAECFPRARVDAAEVDAGDPDQLRAAVGSCQMVVDCVPYAITELRVLRAAAQARVHYLDLTPHKQKRAALEALDIDLEATGRCFLVDAGINPGCPSMLLRLVAGRMESVQLATVSSLYQDDAMPEAGARDMVLHADQTGWVFRDGAWGPAPLTDPGRIDFGPPYGARWTVSVSLPELESLPERLDLDRFELRQAGLNPLADLILLVAGWIRAPRSQKATDLATWLLARALHLSRPPFGLVLQVEVTGERGGSRAVTKIRLSHPDLYEATAIPVVAAVEQVLDGEVVPGWSFMGRAVEPERFIKQLGELSMRVR